MDTFANRVVLITGAGSGLGRQLALTLAHEGASLAGIDRNAESLAALGTQLPDRSLAWAVADVTDRTSLREAVARLEGRLGPIDLLIANAGIGIETPALNFRAEDIEALIRVNLIGVANSVAAVLPGMVERRRGHLVAISSLASFRGLPLMAGYCASKAGVTSLMEAIRIELRPYGIAVTTICPGWIRTPLTTQLDLPRPYLMEVDDAARRIVRAIRQRRVFYAFPSQAAWQVRLLRWLPSRVSDWFTEQALRRLRRGTGASG